MTPMVWSTPPERSTLPGLPLHTAAQTRELDRRAIEDEGVAGYTLMSRAGAFAWQCLRSRWPEARRVLLVCGAGNNAGDGYVIARLALEQGFPVSVRHLVDPARLRGDAARAWADFHAAGGSASAWEGTLPGADVAVDALLGTGLDRPLEGAFREAVAALNDHPAPVLAVDIPSGLAADSGAALGLAVEAAMTVTFIGRKQGLFTGPGKDHCGEVLFDTLGVPGAVLDAVPASARLIGRGALRGALPDRAPGAHKGHFGRVAIFGGDEGMPGAVHLAGEAALRAGAGLVKVGTHPEHAARVPLACAALMASAVDDTGAVDELLAWCDLGALGPGLGRSDWSRRIFEAVLASSRALVLDADGLNLLAGREERREDWILTPHPGEAARLLDCSIADIEADRFAAVRAVTERYGGICVLKGAGTLISDGDRTAVCALGNPGLATAGTGDVLTGVLAAMRGQGLTPFEAACAGVLAHARAGDLAAAHGQRGMIAPDLLATLRQAVNGG